MVLLDVELASSACIVAARRPLRLRNERVRPCRLGPARPPGDGRATVPRVDLERLDEIELVGTDDTPHRLGDYWASRPVVLVFLRHFG